MKTILYNTQTNQPLTNNNGQIVYYNDGFYINGKKPNYPNIIELEVEHAISPTYDSSTHKLVHNDFEADVANGKWTDSYSVEPLSTLELARNTWKYPEFSIKLVLDEDAAKLDEAKFHFTRLSAMGNPIELDKNSKKWHVWINQVESEYNDDYTTLLTSGKMTIQNKPSILD